MGVEEPLQLLRNLGDQTREVMDAALSEFGEIRRRWDELDASAVAQSATDRAETASAMLKVERAERNAEDAERARAETAKAALKDQQRRVAAEEAAEAARKEAEEVRKAAWQQTAEHERARGQAETRATLAEQGHREALELLELTRRELRELATLQQETERRLSEALAVADRADAARVLAEAKVEGAQERARLASEAVQKAEVGTRRAQEETEAARKAEAEARAKGIEAANALATMQSAYGVVVQRLSGQDKQIADLRGQLEAAAERERLLIAAHTPKPEPATGPASG